MEPSAAAQYGALIAAPALAGAPIGQKRPQWLEPTVAWCVVNPL